MSLKILAFNGSLRIDSWNYKMVRIAGNIVEQAGAMVSYLHLNDVPMPLFSEDLESEQGMPVNAKRFKQMLIDHDAFLIASPEYNSSISAALKNALDWASRRESDETGLLAFKGKLAAIMSASPGALGGLRGLVHLRALLTNMGVLVLPQQYALSQANRQFDEEGNLYNDEVRKKVRACALELLETGNKLFGRI